MIHAAFSRRTLGLAFLAAMLLAIGCGGGGGGDNTPWTGSIQVLNNTGMDLADVEVHLDGSRVAEIDGGLAQGATYTFSGLAPERYDVLAIPGGGTTFQPILHYYDNVVSAGQVTSVTMTP